MPQTIELCKFDHLFEAQLPIDPASLKAIIAQDETLKIELENDTETVFVFDDETHAWSPLLCLDEAYPTINARTILAHPFAYYKLTEVADSASACLYSEGNLLYVPGYGMLVDPEENKYIEATPEDLRQLISQGVGVKDAIKKIDEDKALAYKTPAATPTQPTVSTTTTATAPQPTQKNILRSKPAVIIATLAVLGYAIYMIVKQLK